MLDINDASTIYARSGGGGLGGPEGRPPVFKAVGISLAVASGLFIGVSFVLKKMGLLKANVKYNEDPGEGMGYLKVWWWWLGMSLMIIGEILNFVAYAFVDAILVTPLGALSVVVTTVLSAIFLKERLSFVGKVGCFNCIIGSVVIAMNAPTQSSVANIQDMQHFVITPGFLTYAGVIIVACTFIALWAGPRYGNKSMFVYISICSLIGGLSVVATQGLGAAIIAQIGGQSQFKEWFLYVLLVFVIATLLTEIIYLNKALNIFNAALVTPTYYVLFTSATIITSAILFQGFKGTAISITTVIMGFLQICAGVVLLQLSKSAKDVPDAAIFKGDLDQVREVAEQEQPETEPKADAIRGTAAIIRRISAARQKMEKEEAMRYYEEKRMDVSEPPREDEIIEWDGLRRRRTIIGESPMSTPSRRTTTRHPPLGMSKFPDFVDEELPHHRPSTRGSSGGSFFSRSRTSSTLHPHWKPTLSSQHIPLHPNALTSIPSQPENRESLNAAADEKSVDALGDAFQHVEHRRQRSGTAQTIQWANSVKSSGSSPHPSPARSSTLAPLPPPHTSRRQFSFQNVFHRRMSNEPPHSSSGGMAENPGSRLFGFGHLTSRNHHHHQHDPKRTMKDATEEETLGLVKGDTTQSKETDQLHRLSTPTPTPTKSTFDEKEIETDDLRSRYRRGARSVSSSSDDSVGSGSEYKRRNTHTHTRIPSHDKEEEESRIASANANANANAGGGGKFHLFPQRGHSPSPPPPPLPPKQPSDGSPPRKPPPPQSRSTPHLPSQIHTHAKSSSTTSLSQTTSNNNNNTHHHPLPSLPTASHPQSQSQSHNRHPYPYQSTPERTRPGPQHQHQPNDSLSSLQVQLQHPGPSPQQSSNTSVTPAVPPVSSEVEAERRERRERRRRMGGKSERDSVGSMPASASATASVGVVVRRGEGVVMVGEGGEQGGGGGTGEGGRDGVGR
ncbi:hypothetical protein FQN52_006780 [Onygenales sp. PD_12]|nr:hypothetical protein FQN52_006780 [Onygenales sp. PD_12]